MVRRALIPLIVGAASILPVTLLGAFRAAPVHSSSTVRAAYEAEAPETRRGREDVVLVDWVIRPEDLVACETATPVLRRVNHQYPGRVRIVAYAVAANPELVRSFLRRERLAQIQLQSITEREFQRNFAHRLGNPARTPTLLVMSGGMNEAAFDAAVRTAAGRRGVAEFAVYLDTLLKPASAAGE